MIDKICWGLIILSGVLSLVLGGIWWERKRVRKRIWDIFRPGTTFLVLADGSEKVLEVAANGYGLKWLLVEGEKPVAVRLACACPGFLPLVKVWVTTPATRRGESVPSMFRLENNLRRIEGTEERVEDLKIVLPDLPPDCEQVQINFNSTFLEPRRTMVRKVSIVGLVGSIFYATTHKVSAPYWSEVEQFPQWARYINIVFPPHRADQQ